MKKHSFFYKSSLTLVLLAFFLFSLCGQMIAGWKEYNQEKEEYDQPEFSLGEYLVTGHFFQTTFENWESEFLQMSTYVMLTISLRQKGSSESKQLDKEEEVDREPDPSRKDAPWPVRKGGIVLKIYQNSLSIAFVLLFIASFFLHAWGSFRNYNEEQFFQGKSEIALQEFMTGSRFWFESFQNWQSEFIAVASIVVLSNFPETEGVTRIKPVDASHDETGE